MKDTKGPGLYLLETLAVHQKNGADGKPRFYYTGVAICKSPSLIKAKQLFMEANNLGYDAFAGVEPECRVRKVRSFDVQ